MTTDGPAQVLVGGPAQSPALRGGHPDALGDAIAAAPPALPAGVDPLTVGAGIGLLALVLVVVWWWLRLRYRPAAAVLQARLAKVDEVAVLTHPQPDPDAMASAAAVAHLAESAGTTARVQYPGEIRHPENRAFVTVLDLSLDRVADADDLAADDVVLVDHQQPRGFAGASEVDPYAVVDHHPDEGVVAAFADVRPTYGACASLVAEYFEDLDAVQRAGEVSSARGSLSASGDRPVLGETLATGLAYGILSDTKFLTRGNSRAEFAAMEYLSPVVDEGLLDRIANPQVDASVAETRARGVLERDERPPFVVSDVGPVANLDAIPGTAEELIDLEGITAAAVVGEKDGTLYVSGRSRDDRVHVGRALEAAVADLPGAGAGGHARMGGGQIPLEAVAELGPASGVLGTGVLQTRAQLHDRLFDAMAGER